MSDTCDSCGTGGDDLVTVQRIYVTFGDDGRPADHRMADEFETWCGVCRLSYPHQEIDA